MVVIALAEREVLVKDTRMMTNHDLSYYKNVDFEMSRSVMAILYIVKVVCNALLITVIYTEEVRNTQYIIIRDEERVLSFFL